MAYSGSPQDLFASEDSDSDATVDLSARPETSETRCSPSDNDEIVIGSDSEYSMPPKQKQKQRSKHAVSSSDSEDDDSRHIAACQSSDKSRCLSGPGLPTGILRCRTAVVCGTLHALGIEHFCLAV